MSADAHGPAPELRLDKWLWRARFFKSRSLAARVCAEGRVRRNGRPRTKASAAVRPGDVLTFPQGGRVRVVAVTALGERRGPAAEAAGLYCDLAPPDPAPRPGRRARRPAPPPRPAAAPLDRLRKDAEE